MVLGNLPLMIKLAIFDFDGVIADSLPTVVKIINTELNHRINAVLTAEDLRKYGAKALFRKYKISGLQLLIYSKQMHDAIARHLPEIEPVKGMNDVLNKLDGCKMALVTSNSAENAQNFLQANGIRGFEFVLGGIRMFGKAAKFRDAIRRAKVSAEDTLCIGDELSDIESAKKAGIKIAAVTWGFNSRELLEKAKPDFIVDKPEEIIALCKRFIS
jgi:HAD superfamily hydrolase (TIGR01549 family)